MTDCRPPFAIVLAVLSLATAARADSLDARRRALAELNQREDVLAAQIGANRHQLATLLGALELFSRDPPPPLLVSPASAKDAVRAMILSQAIVPQLRARANALAQQAHALAQIRRQAAEASGDLFAAESAIEDRQGRLQALTQDAALFNPPAARAAADALDAQPPPSHLLRPTDGPVAVRFGGRLDGGLRSQGLAYRTGDGAPVRSPADGVVVYAGPLNGWGLVVILRAGGGCHMVLSGLARVTVAAGQQVAASTPVGTMAAAGQKPPELYFEVRMSGEPVDPTRLMGAAGASGGVAGADVNAARLTLRPKE